MTSVKERRPEGRGAIELRPLKIETGVLIHPEGSAQIDCGNTRVLCTASVETDVPPFARDEGIGWVTAEYAMLPRATDTRGRRKQGGRAKEISRLIGRTLRQAVDMGQMPGHQIIVDCDVLQADGGTRTAAITGGWVALALAMRRLIASGAVPRVALREPIAAVSVGIVHGQVLLDLDYLEDAAASVDLNVAMSAQSGFVELQGTAEGAPFPRARLDEMLAAAEAGIARLVDAQQRAVKGA